MRFKEHSFLKFRQPRALWSFSPLWVEYVGKQEEYIVHILHSDRRLQWQRIEWQSLTVTVFAAPEGVTVTADLCTMKWNIVFVADMLVKYKRNENYYRANGHDVTQETGETKQPPSRARSGHQFSCCLVSLHFLSDILSSHPVCLFYGLADPPRLFAFLPL